MSLPSGGNFRLIHDSLIVVFNQIQIWLFRYNSEKERKPDTFFNSLYLLDVAPLNHKDPWQPGHLGSPVSVLPQSLAVHDGAMSAGSSRSPISVLLQSLLTHDRAVSAGLLIMRRKDLLISSAISRTEQHCLDLNARGPAKAARSQCYRRSVRRAYHCAYRRVLCCARIVCRGPRVRAPPAC